MPCGLHSSRIDNLRHRVVNGLLHTRVTENQLFDFTVFEVLYSFQILDIFLISCHIPEHTTSEVTPSNTFDPLTTKLSHATIPHPTNKEA